jgi:hypothetical protein
MGENGDHIPARRPAWVGAQVVCIRVNLARRIQPGNTPGEPQAVAAARVPSA